MQYDLRRNRMGAGKGLIFIVAHEGMQGLAKFNGFLPGTDRFALDQHPYLAFTGPNTDSWDAQWKVGWSAAINDCGYWLNSVGNTPAFESIGSCDSYDQWWTWDEATNQILKTMALSTMDALRNYMFWTWKIGNSIKLGNASSPYWHYKTGVGGYQFEGQMPASATGGVSRISFYLQTLTVVLSRHSEPIREMVEYLPAP